MSDENPEPPVPDSEFMVIATAHLTCPVCDDKIPVPILGRLADSAGWQVLETRPDMTETWAHTWGHEQRDEPPPPNKFWKEVH